MREPRRNHLSLRISTSLLMQLKEEIIHRIWDALMAMICHTCLVLHSSLEWLLDTFQLLSLNKRLPLLRWSWRTLQTLSGQGKPLLIIVFFLRVEQKHEKEGSKRRTKQATRKQRQLTIVFEKCLWKEKELASLHDTRALPCSACTRSFCRSYVQESLRVYP